MHIIPRVIIINVEYRAIIFAILPRIPSYENDMKAWEKENAVASANDFFVLDIQHNDL